MMGEVVSLQEGVNTLPLATYNSKGFSSIYMMNEDNTRYYNEVAPGNVQYGNSTNEYNAPWEVLPEYTESQFYLETNPVYVAEGTFINAVIFGKTYQVRFE